MIDSVSSIEAVISDTTNKPVAPGVNTVEQPQRSTSGTTPLADDATELDDLDDLDDLEFLIEDIEDQIAPLAL